MSRQELVEAYVSGDVTRRTFVRRLTAAGVSLAAALSYAELLRPAAAHAAPGEPEFYEGDVYSEREEQVPPDVITETPTDATHGGVVAKALVDPNRQATQVWAETRRAGTTDWTRSAAVAESGDVDRVVSITVSGLEPSTAYEVRAAAENRSGVAVGEPVAFSTTAAPPPVAVAAASPPPPPAPPPPAPPPADRQAPTVRLEPVKTKLEDLRRTGVLTLQLTPNEDATITVAVGLPQRLKGRKRTRRVTVATRTARGRAGRPAAFRLRFSRLGRRLVKRGTSVKLALTVEVTDRAGNRRRQTTAVRLT